MSILNNKQKRNSKGHFLPANGKRFRQSDLDVSYNVGYRDGVNSVVEKPSGYTVDDISKAFRAGLNASGGWQTHSDKLAKYLRDNNIN